MTQLLSLLKLKVSRLVKVFVMFFRYDLYYINIYEYSIYLTRGGLVSMPTGSLRGAGDDGNYWGVSAYQSELYAYNLNFNSVIVFPSYNVDRWYGFTVQTLMSKTPFSNPRPPSED